MAIEFLQCDTRDWWVRMSVVCSVVYCTVEHEGPVTAVDISMDGMKILAGTKSVSTGVSHDVL